MERKKDKIKASILLTIFTFSICLCCIIKYKSDNYKNMISGSKFTANTQVTLTGTELVISPGEEPVVVSSPEYSYAQGTYDFAVVYSIEGKGNLEVELISHELTTDNNSEIILCKYGGDNSGNVVAGTAIISEYLQDAQFRISYTGEGKLTVSRLAIESSDILLNDWLIINILIIIVYLLIIILLWKKDAFSKEMILSNTVISGKRIDFSLCLVFIVVAAFTCIPLLNSTINSGLDLIYHLNRIEAIAYELKLHNCWASIHSMLLEGYGYPNGIFYPQLFLYFPAFLRYLGMSLTGSYKIFVFIINYITVLFGYISFSGVFSSRKAGLMAAILYTASPYRLSVIYERMAVGEYIALTFIPVLFYGVYAVTKGNKKDWWIIPLSATGLIQSHLLSTEIVAAFCVLLVVFSLKNLFEKDMRIFNLALAGLFSVLLNLWFIVPVLKAMSSSNLDVFSTGADMTKSAVSSISELLSVSTLLGLRNTYSGYIPSGIGLGLIICIVSMLIIYVLGINKDDEAYHMGRFSSWFALFILFSVTNLFPWDIVQNLPIVGSYIKSIQFPFRLMGIATAFMVIRGGFAFVLLYRKNSNLGLLFARTTLVACLIPRNYYLDEIQYKGLGRNYASRYRIDLGLSGDCISQGEYLPSDVDTNDIHNRGRIITATSDIRFFNIIENGTDISFDYESLSDVSGSIIVPRIYYEGYISRVNGESMEIDKSINGLVQINEISGSGHIEISYKTPEITSFFRALSFASRIILLSIVIRINHKSQVR